MSRGYLFCGSEYLIFARREAGAAAICLVDWRVREGSYTSVAEVVAGVRAMDIPKRARRDLVVIPGDIAVLSKTVAVPVVEASAQRATVASEVEQAMPFPLAEMVWDYVVLEDDGVEQTLALVATRREPVEALCEGLVAAGFGVGLVGALPALDARGYQVLAEDPDEPAILVGLAPGALHLLTLRGAHYSLRSVRLAGGEGDAPALEKRLALELTRLLATVRRQQPDCLPRRIWLVGPEAELLTAGLARRLDLPVAPFLIAPSRLAGAQELGEELRRWALPLVGAAQADGDGAAGSVNLLPDRHRVRAEARRGTPALIAGGVLLALAGTVWLTGAWRAEQSAARVLAAQHAQLAPIEARQEQIWREQDAVERIREQVRKIEGLARSRSNWLQFLADLQSRLVAVEDVWIDALAVERRSARMTPAAESEFFTGDPVDLASADAAPQASYELHLSGRMIDRRNPLERVSADMRHSVSDLIDRFGESAFIAAVKDKRFDTSEKGILRFSFTLTVDSERPL